MMNAETAITDMTIEAVVAAGFAEATMYALIEANGRSPRR